MPCPHPVSLSLPLSPKDEESLVPDRLPLHAGPFALGTFSRDGGDPFPGLVTVARVRDLSHVAASVRALVEDWDGVLPRLAALAEEPHTSDGAWHDLADLRVHAPIEPGQILQSGANYRRHVLDLVAAEKVSVHGATPDEARAYARETSSLEGRLAPVDLRSFERERPAWLVRHRRQRGRHVDRTGLPPAWLQGAPQASEPAASPRPGDAQDHPSRPAAAGLCAAALGSGLAREQLGRALRAALLPGVG
jgi:hypothetical protein